MFKYKFCVRPTFIWEVAMKNMVFQRCVCLVLANGLFLLGIAGCGGAAPNPVARYEPGDEKKSCNALYAEMTDIDDEIVVKKRKKTDRDVWNIIWFVTGVFVIAPFFFIDAKGSFEVEIDALKARKRQLKVLFADKDCSPPHVEAETTK